MTLNTLHVEGHKAKGEKGNEGNNKNQPVICLICNVLDELARQEKLDEILDYLRGVGSSGKKVEARSRAWGNWSRLCRSNSKHTGRAFWRVYAWFWQALENRLDEAGHQKMYSLRLQQVLKN